MNIWITIIAVSFIYCQKLETSILCQVISSMSIRELSAALEKCNYPFRCLQKAGRLMKCEAYIKTKHQIQLPPLINYRSQDF